MRTPKFLEYIKKDYTNQTSLRLRENFTNDGIDG